MNNYGDIYRVRIDRNKCRLNNVDFKDAIIGHMENSDTASHSANSKQKINDTSLISMIYNQL